MAKKKKDPLAAAARQVVKDTTNKAVKQTAKPNVKKQQPKQSSRQNVRQSAKDVSNIARNTMRNAGESTKKATVSTAKALPKKKAKPFKASDLSGNTGRGVTKQARKQTKSAYTGASQRKAQAKQKEKDIKAGKFNVPNRLSQADEMMLSQEGKNQVNYYKDQWEKAKARGDKAGMQKAHEEAEKVRLTNPATVKTTTYEGPTQSDATMVALQQYAQAMQAGDVEGMQQAKNLAAYAMLNLPKDKREQSYMTGAYSGGTWGDRALEASESDVLKNQGKNILKSEGAAFASAVPEAAGGYIETVMNAPDINGGSSQLVVKDPNVDKRKANQFDLRGQSRYTEEDARAKADHYQAQAEYLKQIAYATTPLPGVAGRFAVDATAAAGGMGIDLAANTIIPGSGLISMGARTWGSSVQQAKDYQKVNGTDKDPYADAKAYLYGTAIAGTEVLSEKMFGGPWSKIYGRGFADAAVKGATKPTIGKTILKGMLEEGSEELAADLVQWKMPAIYGGETETLPEMLKGAAYDFTLGAALGGLGGAVTAPGQVRAEKVQNLRKRMEAVGYAKDDIDTAFQRMTVGDMETLTDSPDSTLEAWVDTVIDRKDNSSQIEAQSLTGASEEQSSEQTFEGRQSATSEGKTWKALRKRLRESGINDERMLRLIRSRMSAEEMEEAANLRKNDFLEWRDRVTSPDYQPAPREEAPEPTENITAEEEPVEGELVEEEEQAGTDSNMVKSIAEKLMSAGVTGPEMTKAIAPFLRENNATEAERVLSMSEDELKAWARGEEPKPAEEPTPKIKQEDLRQQTEMIAEMAKAEPAPQQQTEDITPVSAISNTLGKAGKATMNGMYNDKQNPVMYSREMIRAYNAGFSGIRLERIGNKTITQIQANAMYRAGATDRQSSLIAQKQNVRNAIIHDKKTAGLLQDEYVEKNVDAKKAKSIDRIAKALGVKVFFADSVGGMDPETKQSIANGSYQGGTVLIAKDSDESVNFVYGHEITHRMKEISPDAYEKLKKFVMEQPESAREVEKTMSVYASYNIPITDEAAIEEVVADYVGMVIDNQDLLEDFARRIDRNVLQKFLDALKAMVGKLTGKEKTDMQEAIKTIENALDTSVKASRKLAKRNPMRLNREATPDEILTGQVVIDSDTGAKYSVRAAQHDVREGEMLDDLKRSGIMSEKEAEGVVQDIEDVINHMLPFADIVDWNEEYTRESRPFSPIKPNSDPLYVLSIDFTTNCKKRLVAGAIIEKLQVEAGRALPAEDQIKIRDLLAKYREMETGFQIACAFCYVEAARLKTPESVNEFLDDKRTAFVNYFAQKNDDFKKYYNAEVEKYKKENSPLKGKKKTEFETWKKNLRQEYKLSDHEQDLLDKAMNMEPEAFLTEKGLTNLVVKYPEIYDVFINKVRSATHSKPVESYVPFYYGDIAKNVSKNMIGKFNDENGFRTASWSDWQVQQMLDEMVAIVELSILGGKMLKYSKFPEVARIFGGTGIMFNMSGVVMSTEPIYDEDGDYSFENFDPDEGVPIFEALEARDMYPDTVGIQCIGNTISQTRALLDTDWVDYVIPYHKSGMSEERRKAIGIDGWHDHESTQQAKPIDSKAKPGAKDDAKNWHKEPKFSEIMVWNGKNGLDCMRKTQRKYIRMCKERGLTPAFPEYMDHPNYWKLLIERKMINHKTGKIIRQHPVRPIFNKKEAFKAIDREVREYDPTKVERAYKYVKDHLDEAGVDISPKMREQSAVLGNTALANYVSEPKEQKLSLKRRDEEYLQAVRDGDMDTVERLVREAAREAGYPVEAYHGTQQFGFTQIDVENESDDGASFWVTADVDLARTYSNATGPRQIHADEREQEQEKAHEEARATVKAFVGELEKLQPGEWLKDEPTIMTGVDETAYMFLDNEETMNYEIDAYLSMLVRSVYNGVYTDKWDDFESWWFSGEIEDAKKALSDVKWAYIDYAEKIEHGATHGNYHLFINPDDLLVVDGNGSSWNELGFVAGSEKTTDVNERIQQINDRINSLTKRLEERRAAGADWGETMDLSWEISDLRDELVRAMGEGRVLNTTRAVVNYASEEGYKGVHFRNIDDDGGKSTRWADAADVYALLDPTRQVKSADPVTYDDEGNIIPLSKRFDPNIPDIRWSLRGGRTSEELAEAYGIIPPGEKRAREARVPRQTTDEDRVSKSIRTVMEAQLTPEGLLPTLDEMIANGEFSYNPITDKAALSKARATLKEKGFLDAYAEWKNDVDEGKVSKDIVTLGWVLYDQSLKDGDVDTTLNILTKMSRTLRVAGQAVQATRILKTLPTEVQMRLIPDPKPKHVQDKIDEYEEEEDDDEFDPLAPDEYDEETGLPKPKQRKPRQKKKPTQEEVDKMEKDTAEFQAKKSRFEGLLKMWNAWRYFAMLCNFRTHGRNIAGNAGFMPIVMSKNITATAAEIALYHTVGKRGKNKMQRTKGFYAPNLFKFAWSDYNEIRHVILNEPKYEGQVEDPEGGPFPGYMKPLNKAIAFNSAMLNAEDMWFSKPHYANALAQYMAANGITAEMMETGVGVFERGPHKGQEFNQSYANAAREYAVLEAQKATYRDTNEISKMFMDLGKKRDNSKSQSFKHVMVEAILPFKKTPANILVRAIEYSPAGFANGMTMLAYGVPKGKCTVAEALDSICAGMSGTGLFLVGMHLAKMGLLVAKMRGDDDEQYYFDKLLGHQQWAIEINDTSYTIDWLAPEIIPMFMGAQYWKSSSSDENIISKFNAITNSLSMVLDPVMELSCLSGIQDFFNDAARFAEGDVDTMTNMIAMLGLSYFSQGIPTLFGQFERAFQGPERMQTFTTDDPEQLLSADWQYQIGKISAKIPGWDYHQVPYVDSWGNTETETNTFKRIVANFLVPWYRKDIDTRPVNKELQRLYDVTGNPDVFPEPGWKTYRFKDDNGNSQIRYLNEEEYIAYSRAKGRENFELASKFINSPAYKNLSDADRAEILSKNYDYSEYKAQSENIIDYKGEPYTWIKNYQDFSNAVGGYDIGDFTIAKQSIEGVTGLKDPAHPEKNSFKNTTSANKKLAIYNSGVKIPQDPEYQKIYFEALDVNSKEVLGWNKAQCEEYLESIRKKGYK